MDFSDYIVYVDESGDSSWKHNSHFPVLCVNYCLFKKEYYLNKLIPRFNKLKFDYWGCDNLVFHERDFRKPHKIKDPSVQSKYKLLEDDRCNDFMVDLTNLLEHSEFLCFGIIIDKERVDDKYRIYDPYHISLSRGLRQIADYFQQNDPKQLNKNIHIVFEKRGRDDDLKLSKAYQKIVLDGSIIENSKANYDFSRFKLELMDKKSNSTGLQIADLTARPIANHYINASRGREKIDDRAAKILLEKMYFCSRQKCSVGEYDIFHQNI